MRILLIDQPLALAAVETDLLTLRPHWTITSCHDAGEALHLVADGGFDVVACAWRVGRTFGPELLRRVQALASDSMRMLLLPTILDTSEAARQVLACAHQCLRKPFAARDLVHAAERLVAMRWILSDATLRQVVGKVDRLPSPPRLYMELQHAASSSTIGLASISRLVSQDPGLASRVLRIANSALFNRGLPVLDLAQAVNRIGLNVLSQIVLACEVFAKPPPGVDVDALRRDALNVSQLAKRLLKDPEQAQLASTAALLADAVKLLPREVSSGSLDAVRAPAPWNDLPTEALLAAYMLGLWGMPFSLVETVAFCRDPSRVVGSRRQFDAVGAVHVARALICGEALDESYLEAVGVAGELVAWRKLAADIAPPPVAMPAPIRVPPVKTGHTPVPGSLRVAGSTPVPGSMRAAGNTPVPGSLRAAASTPVPGSARVASVASAPMARMTPLPGTTRVAGNTPLPGLLRAATPAPAASAAFDAPISTLRRLIGLGAR